MTLLNIHNNNDYSGWLEPVLQMHSKNEAIDENLHLSLLQN